MLPHTACSSCSKPATGYETRVLITIAEEEFSTTGRMVTERSWLDIYPYASWGSSEELPHFQQGQTFMPSELLLQEVGRMCL